MPFPAPKICFLPSATFGLHGLKTAWPCVGLGLRYLAASQTAYPFVVCHRGCVDERLAIVVRSRVRSPPLFVACPAFTGCAGCSALCVGCWAFVWRVGCWWLEQGLWLRVASLTRAIAYRLCGGRGDGCNCGCPTGYAVVPDWRPTKALATAVRAIGARPLGVLAVAGGFCAVVACMVVLWLCWWVLVRLVWRWA